MRKDTQCWWRSSRLEREEDSRKYLSSRWRTTGTQAEAAQSPLGQSRRQAEDAGQTQNCSMNKGLKGPESDELEHMEQTFDRRSRRPSIRSPMLKSMSSSTVLCVSCTHV